MSMGATGPMRYQSVIGFGEVEFIEDLEGKRKALQIVMKQYGDDLKMVEDAKLSEITIFKLVVSSMTGKKSGY